MCPHETCPCSECLQVWTPRTGSAHHVIPVALTQIASNSSLHCVTEWISPAVKLSSHGCKAARLIPLPTDCQHVLAHTWTVVRLRAALRFTTLRAAASPCFYCAVGRHKGVSTIHAYNSQTRCDERLLRLHSPPLQRAHRQPQALHHGRALRKTSCVQQAQGRLGVQLPHTPG